MKRISKFLAAGAIVASLGACGAETVESLGNNEVGGGGGKGDRASELNKRLSGRSLFFSESVEDRVTQITLTPAEGAPDLYRVVAHRSASSPLGGGPAAMERTIGDRMACFIAGIDLTCSQDDTPVDGPRVELTLATDGGLTYEAKMTSFNPWTGRTTEDRIAGHLEASSLCGDGGPALCEIIEPTCPAGTTVSVENGCFGPCVSPVSCEETITEDYCGGASAADCAESSAE